MIVTVTCNSSDTNHLEIRCKDKRFVEDNGSSIVAVDGRYLYKVLCSITSWANNELKEELLIEVE